MSDFGRPPTDCENMISLKVDNLSYRTNTKDLFEEFSRFGEVGDVYIPKDRFTKESRGFAFVRFYERRDAEDAMDEMNGKMFDHRELRVQQAKYGRPSRPAPRGRYGGDRGYDRGGDYSRRRRSRSRSRSPRRRRSPSRSPRRRSPSRSPAQRSQSRSRSRDRD